MNQDLEQMPVEQVLDRFGPNSEEFYLKIRRLIAFVLQRHFKSYSEDHFQETMSRCYCKVLETLTNRPYVPGRGNLRTYIYTIVRNECSTVGYHDRRSLHREVSMEEAEETHQFGFEPDVYDLPDQPERQWRTVLGAYCYEASEAIHRIMNNEVSGDEIASSMCPRSRAAFRVLLWSRLTEGSFV